jgi:hypothetical protein
VIRHDDCRLEIDNLLFFEPRQAIKNNPGSPWVIKYPLFVVGRGGQEVIMPLEGGSTLPEISRAFERFHIGLFGLIAARSPSHRGLQTSRLEAAPTGK